METRGAQQVREGREVLVSRDGRQRRARLRRGGRVGGGGRRPPPHMPRDQIRMLVEALCRRLRAPARVLPGGFLQTTDLISTPQFAVPIGQAFATLLGDVRPDVVLTMEGKGIPLALGAARAFKGPPG